MTADLPERVVPLSSIDVDWEWNSRIPTNAKSWGSSEADEESSGLEGLVRNLLSEGQRQAVDVRSTEPPYYKVTDKPLALCAGFRRVAAFERIYSDEKLKKAWEEKVGPAVSFQNGGTSLPPGPVPGLPWGMIRIKDHGPLTEKQALLVNAGENGTREGLTPPETFYLMRRLVVDHKCTPGEVAIAMGKHATAVSRYLKLLKLPLTVQEHWGRGGDFGETRSYRRAAVEDMLEVAKIADPREAEKAYVELLKDQAPKVDGKAWMERARARATATGAMLARLQKEGFLEVKGSFHRHAGTLVRSGARKLEWSQGADLAERAERAFVRELSRTEENEESAPGQDQ